MVADAEHCEAELVFQQERYFLSIREAPGVTLSIEVERQSDGSHWRGDFTSRYIEEITQRVGNLKSFKTFVSMLKFGILRKSDTLHVDLLTYHDLERLTVRKGANDYHSSSRDLLSDKRYLILTYLTEFDRVHYPLPLAYEEDVEPSALKKCIQRLRDELDDVKGQLLLRQRTENTKEYDRRIRKDDDTGGPGKSQDDTDLEENLADKRTINKLMKKNAMLEEEIRRAKEVERKMSVRLQDYAFEIALLKRRLSSRGFKDVSPRISPMRSKPVVPRSTWNDSSRSSSSMKRSTVNSTGTSSSKSHGSRSSSCPTFRSQSTIEGRSFIAGKQKQFPTSLKDVYSSSRGPKQELERCMLYPWSDSGVRSRGGILQESGKVPWKTCPRPLRGAESGDRSRVKLETGPDFCSRSSRKSSVNTTPRPFSSSEPGDRYRAKLETRADFDGSKRSSATTSPRPLSASESSGSYRATQVLCREDDVERPRRSNTSSPRHFSGSHSSNSSLFKCEVGKCRKSPTTRLNGSSNEVLEIDSRLFALCNYLKSVSADEQ